MIYQKKLTELKELIRKIEYYKYTLNSLVYWDKITYMPSEAIGYRSKVMSFMADEQYKLLSSAKFNAYMQFFDGNKNNDAITDAMVKRILRNAQYVNKVPETEYRQYIELIAVAEQVWEKAKRDDDFAAFEPYLERIFDTFRTFAEYWGYEEDPYDALLGYYEEGLTVKYVDNIVHDLKVFLIGMLSEIRAKEKQSGGGLMLPPVDRDRQQKVWKCILEHLGFDFHRGRVDIGAHPTILASSPSDVRIVNAYDPNDLRSGIFNVLHSGGKGIYQQSINEELLGTLLAEVPSYALEEGIGRFYENIIGRSKGFWSYFQDKLTPFIPKLAEISLDQIYEDINQADSGKVRIAADELTYLLHIIIRYELEKDLINGRLQVKDLRESWNQKCGAYLGMHPASDREGILQDIHWAAGYVGYFPSYFISNLAAAQIANSIEMEHGDMENILASGRFDLIKDWLKEHIFQYGAVYSTEQLLQTATGQALDSKYYLAYLRKKYSEVYKLNIKGEMK